MKTQVADYSELTRIEAVYVPPHAPRRLSGVYGLTDPREPDRIRYVGSSICIERRVYAHTYGVNRLEGNPRAQWTAGLRAEGVKPVAIVLEELDVGEARGPIRHDAEARWISLLWGTGQADLNTQLTPVGHTNSGDSRGKVTKAALASENSKLRQRVAFLEQQLAESVGVEDLL